MSTQSPTPPHRVSTSSLTPQDFRVLAHPLNSEFIRHTVSLGDKCGLTKEGVHLSHVKPGITSTTMHWHLADDEWIYILEAGKEGATLIVQAEGDTEPKEEKIFKGDFLGFPAGKRTAHALRAGREELVYLVGGTRAPVDVCTYPAIRKKLVVDRQTGDKLLIDEQHTKLM